MINKEELRKEIDELFAFWLEPTHQCAECPKDKYPTQSFPNIFKWLQENKQ